MNVSPVCDMIKGISVKLDFIGKWFWEKGMLGYEAAIAALPSANADAVRGALQVMLVHGSAIVKRFASNIEKETRLPDSAWQELFLAIISLVPVEDEAAGADRVAQAIRDAMARCVVLNSTVSAVPSAIPRGPSIDDLRVEAYGRLVTFRQLSAMWRGSSPCTSGARAVPIMSTQALRHFIEDLTSDKGLAAHQTGTVLSKCALGRYIMWSTFDPVAFGPDPFASRAANISDLVATLGLDSFLLFGPPSKPAAKHPCELLTCVLLRYTLPPAYKPHVPTIIEAYAGDGRMNYYFEVFRGSVDVERRIFPRTLAVPSHQESQGVPEVVHSIVFGDQLSAPIEMDHFR